MPEPVVIIGSTARPAGPAGESAENAAKARAVDTEVEAQISPENNDRARSPLFRALARLASGLFAVAPRAVWALTKGVLFMASRYPRHSLGAGVSILILSAVLYTQLQPGKGETQSGKDKGARSPVTVSIPGDAATQVADSGTNAEPTKKTEGDKDGAAKNNGQSAIANDSGKANIGSGATASSDGSAPSHKSSSAPAPEPTALDNAAPPLPSVADAPASGQEPPPAPSKVATTGELVAMPGAETRATPAPEHDQAAATLLSQAPPEPAPLPASSTIKENFGNADPVGTAAAPSPATTAEPSPSPAQSGQPATLPAPIADPLQLATALEPVGDQKRSSSASAPDVVHPEPANRDPSTPGASGHPDPKATDGESKAPPTKAQNSQVEVKSGPAQDPTPTTTEPERAKNEPTNSEGVQTPNQLAEKAAPGTFGLAQTPGGAAMVSLPDQSMPSPSEPSSTVKPDESSAPSQGAAVPGTQSALAQPAVADPVSASPAAPPDSRFESKDSKTRVPNSKSQTPDSNLTQTTDSQEPEKRTPQITLDTAKAEAPRPTPTSSSAKTSPSTLEELTNAGWVAVPNSGKLIIDESENADSPRGNSADRTSANGIARRDVRAHAAKDVNFEEESPSPQATPDGPRNGQSSNASISPAAETRSRLAAERVESVPHVVESGENFWTISRQYYSSGRYYRALWKANADKYPEIDKLTVNDVIMVPSVEDLDPNFIDPPRTIAPAALGGATRSSNGRSRSDSADLAESSISSSSVNRDEPVSTTRTNRGLADGVPVRRSSRTDPDLDLPAPKAVTRRDSGTDRVGHRPDAAAQGDDNDNESETRVAARPRASVSGPLRGPVYKVRQYDTLRSIARDMLGDSHRASEILDLNRDLIDDPTHLIVGQVLEMPEDARTTVRRSASRQ